MTTEQNEILDMDRDKTLKINAKPIDITDLLRRVEALESQEHTCDCPNKIIDMGKEIERLDFLDENDEKLRQGINESHRDLETKLAEEHRLRVASEEEISKLNRDNAELWERVTDMKAENTRFSRQNLYIGIAAAVCSAISIIVIALAVTGHL